MNNIISEINDGVLKLTINRAAQKNAINGQMYGVLADELERAQQDKTVGCVVITGIGDTFTAGNDLQDFVNPPDQEDLPAVRFLYALVNAEKPLMALVNGPAIGIGLTMLLHCDLVLAASSAKFTAPFAKLGLVPEAASSMLLSEIVGRAMANDILLAGRVISAQEALQFGLVSRVLIDSQLQQVGEELAGSLASLPVNAMAKSKSLINARRKGLILDVMKDEFLAFDEQLKSPEFKQAIAPLLKSS